MKIDILTLFPGMFEPVLGESMIKIAREKGLVEINLHDLRDYTTDKHKKADDKPFGGGQGMVMLADPIFKAVEKIKSRSSRVVYLTPEGKKLTQKLAQELSENKHIILICGHYEGIDERVRQEIVTEEVSIGDYVLTCGELPAMVLVDSVVRLVPGVLGDERSAAEDSFSEGLLDFPVYTRPAVYRGMKVPDVLLSGDHEEIKKWRKTQRLQRTIQRRPDLLKKAGE